MTIQQTLKVAIEKLKSKNIPSADLDAEVLLLEALNKYRRKKIDKSWLYINNNYKLKKQEERLFSSCIKQRLKHKPVAYITNKKEFYGYEFYVNENVLIPRPETEFMTEEVLRIIKNSDGRLMGRPSPASNKIDLIDVGTGSGCIIISILNELAKNKKNVFIKDAYANDISSEAIKIAKLNAKKYKLSKKIKFYAGDFEKFIKEKKLFASSRFIITANLPYVKKNEFKNLPPNVKKFEPKISLVGGKSGIELIEKSIDSILNIKTNKNNLSGYIIFEADPAQMKKIKSILEKKLDAIDIKIIKDLRGKNRLISAKIQLISPN